jgi:hypothetical protein
MQSPATIASLTSTTLNLLGQLNVCAEQPLMKLDFFQQSMHSDSPPGFANRRGLLRKGFGQVFGGVFLYFLVFLDQNEDKKHHVMRLR